MRIAVTTSGDSPIVCATCNACCCRLEVLLITDTGVPECYVDSNEWGARVMARLDDGWCVALDRDSFRCTIYKQRPLICRDFEMGGDECRAARIE